MMTADPIVNRCILVIDDNPSICEDFRKILQRSTNASSLYEARTALFEDIPLDDTQEGFEVDCADQGQTGLAMVQSALQRGNPYAVAFVDVLMPPGWDGVETIDHLWHIDPELEVVICTAFIDLLQDRLAQFAAHHDKLLILRKPFDNIEVRQLASALSHKWQLAQQVKHQLASLTEMVEQRTQALQEVHARLQLYISQCQRAEEMLVRQAQELAQFVYVVSHDLQEPLRLVTSYLQLLAQHYCDRLDARANEYMALAIDGAIRMQQLLADLLTYSRVEE